MTYEQYWYGDVIMVRAFYEAEKLRQQSLNNLAWLLGLYIYEALCDVSPLLHAFAKKGTKPHEYRVKPIDFNEVTNNDTELAEDQQQLQAEVYMRQMMYAGKRWGKK